jgi:hypothetical protein
LHPGLAPALMTDLNTTSIAASLDEKIWMKRYGPIEQGKKFVNIPKILSRLPVYVLYSVVAGKPLKSDAVTLISKKSMQ